MKSAILAGGSGLAGQRPHHERAIPQKAVDRRLRKIMSTGRWLAEFRADLESFVSRLGGRGLHRSCVHERPPQAKLRTTVCDPAGGGGRDSAAIAHRDGAKPILDCVRELRPLFSPEAVVAQFSQTLKSYPIRRSLATVCRFVAGQFARHVSRTNKAPCRNPISILICCQRSTHTRSRCLTTTS
jgi:hypothetical protein